MTHRDMGKDDRSYRDEPEHQHFIFEGVEFPVSKAELVGFVTDLASDVDTMNLIRALPDREYASAHDVWRSIGEATRKFGSGQRDLGQPRDDIGKQATAAADGHVNQP